MYNSPITLSKDDPKHITTILIVLQEEFTRSHGEPIGFNRVLYNETFKKLAEDNRYVHTKKEDQLYIRTFLEELITKGERFKEAYYIGFTDKAERKKEEEQKEPTLKIFRRNKYSIKNEWDLKQLIQQNPGGLEVDDELLNFTYRKVE